METFTSIDRLFTDKTKWNGSWWVNSLKLKQMTLQHVSANYTTKNASETSSDEVAERIDKLCKKHCNKNFSK